MLGSQRIAGPRGAGTWLQSLQCHEITPQEQTKEIPKEDSILWMGAAAQKSQKTRAEEEEQNESMVLSASKTKHVLFLAIALLEPSAC